MAKKAKSRRAKRGIREKKLTAETVFQHLALVNVRLLDLHAHLEIHNNQLPNENQITANLAVGHTPDSKHLQVTAVIEVNGRPQGTTDQEKNVSLLALQMVFQCVYQFVDASPSAVLAHAEKIAHSGMLIIWPHAREVIQSTTSRMGITPVILPMFAVGSAVAGKKGQPMRIAPPQNVS